MSGGHFEFSEYSLEAVADEIDQLVETNDDESLDEWGQRRGEGYAPTTLEKFREAALALRRARAMLHRVDWLVSGDDGEDSFHRRWAESVPVCPMEAERDALKDKLAQLNKDMGCELRDPNGTIWEHCAALQEEVDQLRQERGKP